MPGAIALGAADLQGIDGVRLGPGPQRCGWTRWTRSAEARSKSAEDPTVAGVRVSRPKHPIGSAYGLRVEPGCRIASRAARCPPLIRRRFESVVPDFRKRSVDDLDALADEGVVDGRARDVQRLQLAQPAQRGHVADAGQDPGVLVAGTRRCAVRASSCRERASPRRATPAVACRVGGPRGVARGERAHTSPTLGLRSTRCRVVVR